MSIRYDKLTDHLRRKLEYNKINCILVSFVSGEGLLSFDGKSFPPHGLQKQAKQRRKEMGIPRIDPRQEGLLEGLEKMGFRMREVLQTESLMTRFGMQDSDVKREIPEDFQKTVIFSEGQLVKLVFNSKGINFNTCPNVLTQGSPKNKGDAHLTVNALMAQVKKCDKLIVIPWNIVTPYSSKSIRDHLIKDHTMVDFENWLEAIFVRRIEVEFREGREHSRIDELVVHDCRKDGYDWTLLRRRIEEGLRKTASHQDMIAMAAMLGIKF